MTSARIRWLLALALLAVLMGVLYIRPLQDTANRSERKAGQPPREHDHGHHPRHDEKKRIADARAQETIRLSARADEAIRKLSRPVAETARKLVTLSSDSDGKSVNELIEELEAILRTDPSLVHDVVRLLEVLFEEGIFLGTEVVANALGRTRFEAGLTGLVRVCDRVRVESVEDAMLLERLITALIQSPPGTRRGRGLLVFARFAEIRDRVTEGEVRRYLREKLEKLTSDGDPMTSAVAFKCALGLCMGELDDTEASSYLDLLKRAPAGPHREATLRALRYAAHNETVREWVMSRLEARQWSSPTELEHLVVVAGTELDERPQLVARLLDPGLEGTPGVVFDALSYVHNPRGGGGALVARIREVAFHVDSAWPKHLRVKAADAYVNYVLAWQLESNVVESLENAFRREALESEVRDRLVRGVSYLRAREIEAMVELLADVTVPIAVRRAIVDRLVEKTVLLTSVQRKALLRRIRDARDVPETIRAAIPADH